MVDGQIQILKEKQMLILVSLYGILIIPTPINEALLNE